MTLMKSMVSLHQGPKVSKAKPLKMYFDEIIELYLLCLRLQVFQRQNMRLQMFSIRNCLQVYLQQ
jgi:hypothetical protein